MKQATPQPTIEGTWTVYYTWLTSQPAEYYSIDITFNADGTLTQKNSSGGTWTSGANGAMSWAYKVTNPGASPITYSGNIIGYAMLGKMTGCWYGGWWYAVKKDYPYGGHGVTDADAIGDAVRMMAPNIVAPE